jgi:aerotaxis receptor
MGFKDYLDFSSEAFSQCIQFRYEQLQIKNQSRDLQDLNKVQEMAKNIFELAGKAIRSYQAVKFIPLNMQIYADNLGNAPTLSVVAEKYQGLVTEIQDAIRRFEEATVSINESIRSVLFALCSKKLNVEMAQSFIMVAENDATQDYTFEISQLEAVAHESQSKSLMELERIISVVKELLLSCENLRMVLLGLELIRISGRVEIAKMSTHSLELSDLMGKLSTFKQEVFSSILKITESAHQIDSVLNNLRAAA